MLAKQQLIKQSLESMMENGQLRVGQRLPSELQMAKEFGVSRETFRAAVRMLEKEGRLLVKHGVGTFVIQPLPLIPSSLEKLTSIGHIIRTAQLDEGESRVSLKTEACSPEAARALDIRPGDEVVILERVRTAEGEPVAFSINIIPRSIAGDAFDQGEFHGSLLDYFESRLGRKITTADSEICVPLHIDRNCQRLLLHPQTTVLLLKQVHYDDANKPVLYSLDYLRNDVFTFRIRRTT
ncbi:GntR family transcriptional regulator [Paenibacillus sp. OAS669]|uniref:GntR family transcriptional regulator n=1 Tax=Paenibacillus sp. OAS669 TaxID=2663821 RepID=UPI00178B356C|nr:GntR family transcriptional regulator [Paenibacillus sp. OAS669]MBE1445738.1 GntR family transcriptional regulator [Paenibacillus sp. OAS669]